MPEMFYKFNFTVVERIFLTFVSFSGWKKFRAYVLMLLVWSGGVVEGEYSLGKAHLAAIRKGIFSEYYFAP